jgi:hypothetical protein
MVVAPPVEVAVGAFSYTATIVDPGGLAATVSVTVNVQNRPPVANADTVDVTDGRPRTVDLVANDTDADSGGALAVSELLPTSITFSGGGTGTVVLAPDGRVTVDPGDGLGSGSFTYRVRDIDGGVSASATVTVNAPPANQTPTATDQSISVTVGTSTVVDLQASDPDGQPLRIVGPTFSDPDRVVVERSGLRLSILATVPGTFTVTYEVTDGEATSSPATLTVIASAPATASTTVAP